MDTRKKLFRAYTMKGFTSFDGWDECSCIAMICRVVVACEDRQNDERRHQITCCPRVPVWFFLQILLKRWRCQLSVQWLGLTFQVS